jgi:hypothetical protein
MKKILLISISLAISLSILAQEKSKQQEVGLIFNDLNSFGLTFKTGTNRSMWRFNTLLIAGDNINYESDSYNNRRSNTALYFKFGKEFHYVLVDNLEFRVGADVLFNLQKNKDVFTNNLIDNYSTIRESVIYESGINLIFGLNYVINNKLIIGAEILPYISYTTGNNTAKNGNSSNENVQDISEYSYGLSNQSAMLSIAYRF